MISRRKALGAMVGALATPITTRAHRESPQAAAGPYKFVLRIVGTAAYRHTDGSGLPISASLPSGDPDDHLDHYAIALVEKQAFAITVPSGASPCPVSPAKPMDWYSADARPADDDKLTDLRALHHDLAYEDSAYYRRRLPKDTKISVGSGESDIDKPIALAPFQRSLVALDKSPDVNPLRWDELSAVKLTLGGGKLQNGPPSRPSLGAGMRWRFPVGWIFKSDPRLILTDCIDFVWSHDGTVPTIPASADNALSGIPTRNVTVWIVNGTKHRPMPDGEPEKLEHTKLFWSFYNVDPAKMPLAELDADFPKRGEAKEAGLNPPPTPPALGVEIRMPPAVELCYQGALDFDPMP